MYTYISPEVAGGFGDKTIVDSRSRPPSVINLNYEFFGWLGDDILTSVPCYIFSERLVNEIKKEKLTGIQFDYVLVTKSEVFLEMQPDLTLPRFFWGKIDGVPGIDDFVLAKDLRLLLSEKALNVIGSFNVKYADFEQFVE
jgi:hypothetical protein